MAGTDEMRSIYKRKVFYAKQPLEKWDYKRLTKSDLA